jgi:hypothetical protein
LPSLPLTAFRGAPATVGADHKAEEETMDEVRFYTLEEVRRRELAEKLLCAKVSHGGLTNMTPKVMVEEVLKIADELERQTQPKIPA